MDKYNRYCFKVNKCIICNNELEKNYFKDDLKIPVGLYCIEKEEDNISIPYNIVICPNCNNIQNRYLGNLDLVYKYGHNEGTGKIYNEMHNNLSKIIIENNNIKNILEVGCSVAILSDLILKNTEEIFYTIIEPNLNIRNDKRRKIYSEYIENIDNKIIDSNDTLILSHVLEHFYEPIKILDKLFIKTNIKYFYLAWPDLDHYINNNIVNILTVEHIFYISTNYLEKIIESYGFKLILKNNFKNHTIFYFFERKEVVTNKKLDYKDSNNENLLNNYTENINMNLSKINQIINRNNDRDIYLWPCSTHNITMLIYNKINMDRIAGFLDNSPNKINKKVIQFNKGCFSFDQIDFSKSLVILNGGPFNEELIIYCKKTNLKCILL